MSTLLEEMAKPATDSAAEGVAREIETIRSRFEEAAAALKRGNVEELPWYVFIGAPGSGKTTALVNSGLRFIPPTAAGAAPLAGVGGTRNCDWWFTDEAVLLDTAGRYTTQESNAPADAAAWHGFLALLKQHRPAPPLNGAFVTTSVLDLMLWNKKERARFAAHVRMRLSEMYAALGARFPVYLLVTKADLLAGFIEFFGDLDASDRAQVWGTTFRLDADPSFMKEPYAKEFDALEERLNDEMLARVHEERDLQRRAAIYRFPQQFRIAGPLLGDFLAQAFGVQVNHRPIQLRGVYFTSGTQEGNPIDRVLGSLQRIFKLEHSAATARGASGKSFFVTRLLREVVFPEKDLAVGEDAKLA